MIHPTEETLNDYVERELSPAEQVRVATHLDMCADCALVVADIQHIIREAASLGPLNPPPRVWERIQTQLPESTVDGRNSSVDSDPSTPGDTFALSRGPEWRTHRSWTRFAWAMATAALVVLAFVTGRLSHEREQQTASRMTAAPGGPASSDQATVRERVLLIAVGDHLERSQMVLVELAHAETHDVLDISAERQLADDLVASNRLYRQTALQMGQQNVAGLLDELERVLVEVAHGPSTVSMRQLADIQQRIESQGILFKVKVIGSEIRHQPVS
jgi:predicted anti-sigma-YlaC factor YlaD